MEHSVAVLTSNIAHSDLWGSHIWDLTLIGRGPITAGLTLIMDISCLRPLKFGHG